ncbi:hypothetical protein QNH46_03495 [Paenibacillus woosongensis]|uniref:Uncharacterized protein n=1 Tax=Paenibacillus woosongensis TaxID=307580 RepID=A0AA95ICL3_9BACL|nr:hypothetical protein [Paenibacillus woosongensis]WHX49758.1 hypothetical protein QNH46_03495 [Paenibacillus woosongensis]
MNLRKLVLLALTVLLLLGSFGPVSTFAEGEVLPVEVRGHQRINDASPSLDEWVPDIDTIEIDDTPLSPEELTVTDSTYMFMLAAAKVSLVIYPGESVQFTNETSTTTTLTTDAKSTNNIRVDYVSYNADGKVVSDDMAYTGNPLVYSKGGYTVVSADYGYPVTVTFNDVLTYSYVPVPALLKTTLHRGESYLFSNESLAARSIISDATSSNGMRYDFAVYKSDGSLEKSSFDAYSKPSFSVGDTIVLTGASDIPVTVAVPYEGFYGYETDESAYDSLLLYPGESHEFTNVGTKSDRPEHAGTSKDKFDYVVYSPDGSEVSRGTNTTTLPLVAVGRRVAITLVTENPVRVGAPYRSFMRENRRDEALSRVTVSPGDSYIFTNNGTLRNGVKNDARAVKGRYDYVVYDVNGDYVSQGFNSLGTPTLSPGSIVIFTVRDSAPVTFEYADDFSAEVSDEPSHFRVTLSRGESFEFRNISSTARYLYSIASSSSRFDWAEYYPDGTQQGRRANTYTNPQVAKGNSIVVTAVSDIPVTFGAIYRLFDWKDKEGVAISKQIVHNGESYLFTNIGSRSRAITSDTAQSGGKFDVAIYNNDGSVDRGGFDEKGSVLIPAGGYAIVTGQSVNPVTFSYTDSFTSDPSAYPAMLRATVLPGNSYTYVNISGQSEYLYSDATSSKEFAYVLRRPDGTIRGDNPSRYTPVSVPAEHSITVAPLTEAITFGGVYTSFTGVPGENPAVNKVTLSKNESYLFVNLQSSSQTLTSDASNNRLSMFDYAIYAANGEPLDAEFDQQGSLSVPGGAEVVVTVVTDQSVTFTYGQSFQAVPSLEQALLKSTLSTNQSAGFKNIGSFAAKLTTNASTSGNRSFDYTILDSNGTVIREGEKATVSYPIPAGGTIQVKTALGNPVTFAAPYRTFETVDVQEYHFEELLHRQVAYVYKAAGQNGYYRFVAPETGQYRFATKELRNFSQQPELTLYDQPELTTPILPLEDSEQEFGVDYTVWEFDLEGGKPYYLKLTEKNSQPFEFQIMVALMEIKPEASFRYRPDGRLTQIIYPSGDILLYDYDSKGNLKQRTKKIYPF